MNFHDLAPVLAILAIMSVPIIKILVRHQQQMAMILHQQSQPGAQQDVARLAAEVNELRQMVAQQTLALDSLAESNKRLSAAIEGPNVQNVLRG